MYIAEAYGTLWMAENFDELLRMIDEHGEKNGLRAVSVVADWVEVELIAA